MNTRQMADKVQSKGRHGDSILVHMHPAEVAGIASLTPGGLTINPDTGKPEAFAFLLPMLAAWGGGAAASAMGYGALGVGIGAGLGSAAGTKVIGGSNQDALLSGLLAGTTAGLMAPTNPAPAAQPAMGAVTTTPLPPPTFATAGAAPSALSQAPTALGSFAPQASRGLNPSYFGDVMSDMGLGSDILANPAASGLTQGAPSTLNTSMSPISGVGAPPAYTSAPVQPAAPTAPKTLWGQAGEAVGLGDTFNHAPTGKSAWDNMSEMQKTMASGVGLAAGVSIADSTDRHANPYEPPGKKTYDLPEQFPSDENNRGLIYNSAPQDYAHGFTDEWGFFHAARGGMVPPPRGYAKGGIAGIFNQAINPMAFGKANLEQLKGGNIDPGTGNLLNNLGVKGADPKDLDAPKGSAQYERAYTLNPVAGMIRNGDFHVPEFERALDHFKKYGDSSFVERDYMAEDAARMEQIEAEKAAQAQGYAYGGQLPPAQAGLGGLPPQGMPPQGAMPPQGPPQQGGDEQAKMQLIMKTEAALKGEVPPEQAQAIIKAFVAAFGQEALQMLVQKVSQEMQQGGQQGRTVQGPGTGTSDSVPAVIDGQEPVALSSGEYIVPEETVKKVGKPNLDALVQQTTGNAAVGAKPRREILPRAA